MQQSSFLVDAEFSCQQEQNLRWICRAQPKMRLAKKEYYQIENRDMMFVQWCYLLGVYTAKMFIGER